MNKEKLAKIKNKIKENAPQIIAGVTAVAAVVGVIYTTVKANQVLGEMVSNDFQLTEVDSEKRNAMMSDEKTFGLFELSEDEYLLARRTIED